MQRTARARSIFVAVALAASVVAAVGAAHRRQVVSYATHLKGAPGATVPWAPRQDGHAVLLHVAVAGDIGDSGDRLDATAAAVAEIDRVEPFDRLLLLGDNAYPDGDPALLQGTVFDAFSAVLDRGAGLLAILGNHDVKKGNADAQVEVLGMRGRWWAEHLGDVLLVGLDSNLVDSEAQRAWLQRTLAHATERWKIVALHHPPYSAGYQGSSGEARHAFSPLFERYGVQLVLSGHDHDYQRSYPMNGVTYVVSGAGAGTRRTGSRVFTAVSFSWHHFLELIVEEDELVVRAVSQDLSVADELVLPLRLPAG